MKIWQAVGKLRRRHGLVMSGEPREPGYRVVDWTWEAKRVRSSERQDVCGVKRDDEDASPSGFA